MKPKVVKIASKKEEFPKEKAVKATRNTRSAEADNAEPEPAPVLVNGKRGAAKRAAEVNESTKTAKQQKVAVAKTEKASSSKNAKQIKATNNKVKEKNQPKTMTDVSTTTARASRAKNTAKAASTKVTAEGTEKLTAATASTSKTNEGQEKLSMGQPSSSAETKVKTTSKVAQKRKSPKTSSSAMRTIAKARRNKKVVLELPKLLTQSGVVFVIGTNDAGQIGRGENFNSVKFPKELEPSLQCVDIAAGAMHSACLTSNGQVYTFGCNDDGALGRITESVEGSDLVAGLVVFPKDVVIAQITAGDSHCAALTDDGCVYVWGDFRNNAGSIGLTLVNDKPMKSFTPVQILDDVTIVSIFSGGNHLLCLSKEGVVYTCGNGENGQLGRIAKPTSSGTSRRGVGTMLKPEKIQFVIFGKLKRFRPFIDAIFGGVHTSFLRAKDSGKIFACGLNNHHQLGLPDESAKYTPKFVPALSTDLECQKICSGDHHTLVLDSRGPVYAIGRKEYGRLGLGPDSPDCVEPTIIPTLQDENSVDISANVSVSFSVSARGQAYAWGSKSSQLGLGDDDDDDDLRDHAIPEVIETLSANWHVMKVSAGGQHTLILASRKATAVKTKK